MGENTQDAQDILDIQSISGANICIQIFAYISAYRRDREGRRGGGVAVYVKTNCRSSSVYNFSYDDKNFEILWIIVTNSLGSVAIGAIYHPPKPIYSTDSLLDFIERSIEELSITNYLIILAGDLNTLMPYRVTERTGLIDIVHAPTRGASCLDHILVSDNYQYDSIKVIKSIGNSDHDAIVAYCGPPIINQSKQRKTHTYRPASPAANASYLSHLSSVNPANFIPLCITDPQAAFDHFYTFLSGLLDKFFPLKTVTITSSDLDFVTPEIKTALRRKNLLMHQGKIDEANALASKIGSLITKHNSRSLVHMKHGEEAADLWSMVKKVTSKRTSPTIPSDITAHSLNNHNAAISTDPAYEPTLPKASANPLSPVNISEYQVFQYLDHLKHTATGLDSIPSWFLRLSAPVLAAPLAFIINLSLSTSSVPTQWKSSFILPIPKVSNLQLTQTIDQSPSLLFSPD